MTLRAYTPADLPHIITLFHSTVHSVNAADYTPAELDAWAPDALDEGAWAQSLLENHSIVAVEGGQIIGFGDMDSSGYFTRLYTHRDFQRRHIASKIADALEQHAREQGIRTVTAHASITALPFFLRRGYRKLGEHTITRSAVTLRNYTMEKQV